MTNTYTAENGTTIELSAKDLYRIHRIYWIEDYLNSMDSFLEAYSVSPESYSAEEKRAIAEAIVDRVLNAVPDYENDYAEDVITSFDQQKSLTA